MSLTMSLMMTIGKKESSVETALRPLRYVALMCWLFR
jgi:hypothetical protein